MTTALQPSRVRSRATTDSAHDRATELLRLLRGRADAMLPPPRFRAFCAYCERRRGACITKPCPTRAERTRTVRQYDRTAKIERRRYRALALGMGNTGWNR